MLIFLACTVLPGNAYASIAGSVTLTADKLEKTSSDGSSVDAMSFSQNYSLYYAKSGLFRSGTLGNYNVKLGYQWVGVDSERNGESFSVDDSKILYQGEINIAPGALPFRLYMYSYDMNKIRPSQRRLSRGLFRDFVYNDVAGGIRRETGITLLAGIRNGSYLGRYREIMSKFPRLLVDYNELYVEDVEKFDPVNYTKRDLAFISLNKKDNWFHYMYSDYTDHINPNENHTEKTYLLGTIDHLYKRHWINLTNWMKMAVDGSLNVYTGADNSSARERWSLNNFYRFSYDGLSGSAYPNYQRSRSKGAYNLRQTFNLPVYASKNDHDRLWRTRLVLHSDEEMSSETLSEQSNSAYWQGDVLLDKNAHVLYRPGLAMDVLQGDRGEGQAARFSLELMSNRRLRKPTDWTLVAQTTYLTGDTEADKTVDFIDQFFQAQVNGKYAVRGDWGVTQLFNIGYGTYGGGTSLYLSPGYVETSNEVGLDQKDFFLRSLSSFQLGYISSKGMRNTLRTRLEYKQNPRKKSVDFEARHNLAYDKKNWRYRVNNIFTTEDPDLTDSGTAGEGDMRWSFSHQSSVKYGVGKALTMGASFGLVKRKFAGNELFEYTVGQDLSYHLYRKSLTQGRKLLDFSQSFSLTSVDNSGGSKGQIYRFYTSATYHYNRVTRFGTSFKYHLEQASSSDTAYYTSTNWMDVRFPKLSLRLAYSYGKSEESVEHYYQASVNKSF